MGHCEQTEQVMLVLEWEGLRQGFRRKRLFQLKSEGERSVNRAETGCLCELSGPVVLPP